MPILFLEVHLDLFQCSIKNKKTVKLGLNESTIKLAGGEKFDCY